MATFFVGWPWLWAAPWTRLHHFLASGTQRQTIHVFYWGQVWADRDVPWHYPVVMFLVTIPLGLLLLGCLGIWSKRRSLRCDSLCAGSAGTLVFVLVTFMLPGAPVYDGVRLFLMTFPLWAVFVGIGAKWLVGASVPVWQRRHLGLRMAVVALLVAAQGFGLLAYHPCYLSYYNLLVGGLPGAERLGFEMCYWGDALVEPILAEAMRHSGGKPVLMMPSLAPFHGPGVRMSSPALADHRVDLMDGTARSTADGVGPRCLLVYRRRADLPPSSGSDQEGRVLAEYRKQGVWLSRVVELPEPPTSTRHR
ncbi:MAG: hypothetical protein HUU20_10030 [Pirellulales bacterium]|nr:hypothetical protein [Pirellulales bacterium]